MSGPFRAVVFDLDGVLWDGEPLYHEAFNVLLAPHGHVLTDDDYNRIIGLSLEACWGWVRDRFALTVPDAEFLRAYNRTVLELLERPLEPLPGVRELIGELRERRLPIAVASSSLRRWVDATLSGLGLADAFETTVSASDVRAGKPAPDLFLEAARRIEVPAERCLAVEDTGPGLRAAKAAGMFAVQVRGSSTAQPPQPEADLVLDSLAAFDLSLVAPPGPAAPVETRDTGLRTHRVTNHESRVAKGNDDGAGP